MADRLAGELRRELDALRLAAGKRRGGLAKMDVSEADVAERFKSRFDFRNRVEDVTGLVDGQFEDFIDVEAFVADVQSLMVVALPMALLTRHIDVRKELHFNLLDTVAVALLATAALYVEGETAGAVAADLRVWRHGENLADRVEKPRVGGGIGARRTADRRLVDDDHLVNVLQPFDGIVLAWFVRLDAELLVDGPVEDAVDKC